MLFAAGIEINSYIWVALKLSYEAAVLYEI